MGCDGPTKGGSVFSRQDWRREGGANPLVLDGDLERCLGHDPGPSTVQDVELLPSDRCSVPQSRATAPRHPFLPETCCDRRSAQDSPAHGPADRARELPFCFLRVRQDLEPDSWVESTPSVEDWGESRRDSVLTGRKRNSDDIIRAANRSPLDPPEEVLEILDQLGLYADANLYGVLCGGADVPAPNLSPSRPHGDSRFRSNPTCRHRPSVETLHVSRAPLKTTPNKMNAGSECSDPPWRHR